VVSASTGSTLATSAARTGLPRTPAGARYMFRNESTESRRPPT
jgi:hypothetical protein